MPGSKKVGVVVVVTMMMSYSLQIKYAGSEAHVTELLETVCNSASDYAVSTESSTGVCVCGGGGRHACYALHVYVLCVLVCYALSVYV